MVGNPPTSTWAQLNSSTSYSPRTLKNGIFDGHGQPQLPNQAALQEGKCDIHPPHPQLPTREARKPQDPRSPILIHRPAFLAEVELMIGWLQSEKLRVSSPITSMVESVRGQLYRYAAIVRGLFPLPPIGVTNNCIFVFWKCKWDITRQQPIPGSQAPNSNMIYVLLCDLSALFCYFYNYPMELHRGNFVSSEGFQAVVSPVPESPQEVDSRRATIVSNSDPAKEESSQSSGLSPLSRDYVHSWDVKQPALTQLPPAAAL